MRADHAMSPKNAEYDSRNNKPTCFDERILTKENIR